MAHEVGLGKSYILIGTAMERRRLGLSKKPMIVVPTNLVEQFRKDFIKAYPLANVLAAEKKSFKAQNRKEFTSRIATGDWDAVIIGDSQFSRIPTGSDLFAEFLNEELAEARAQLSEMKANREDYRTIKEIENAIEEIENDIHALADREAKDDTVNFEDLGVDNLLVDEAHRMKSLWFQTKMGRVRGVPRTKSKRALDTYIKTKYITRLNNGNGVVFSTGTPITNTMAEAWILSKFLDEGMLKEMGMQHFDSWAANFGETVTRAEGFPENPSKLRMMTRFAMFRNVPEAAALFRRVADVRYADDIPGFDRPKMKGGKMQPLVIQPSAAQLDYIQQLVHRASLVRGKPPVKGGDNMLVVTNDGRKAAIDMRMVDGNAEDDPESKLNQAAQLAARTYHESRDSKMTQLVMLDLREGAEGFDAYKELRRKMISLGVPEKEIAFIQDFDTSIKKQGLFNDVNDGKVAIVLGSTETLGVGVNVQRRLGQLLHIDAPWRPDGIEQRNGRAIRQGNLHSEVAVTPLVTEKTFDAYGWDLLKRKAEFIRQFMKGDPSVREIEDVDGRALNFDEISAIASGDVRLLQKMEMEQELTRLLSLKKAHTDQQFDNKMRVARLPEQIAAKRATVERLKADIKIRDENKLEKFGVTVDGKHYADRKEAGAAINDLFRKQLGKAGTIEVGKYAGFPLSIDSDGSRGFIGRHEFHKGLTDTDDKGNRQPSPLGTVQSMEGALRGLEAKVDNWQSALTRDEKELTDRKAASAAQPFQYSGKITELESKLSKLNHDLGINKMADDDAPPEEEKATDEDDEDTPDDLTMSFLGLQGIYNRIARLLNSKRTAAGGAAPPAKPPTTPPVAGIPMEPPGERRGAEPGEKAGNIRLDKLNTSDEVLDLIRDTAKTHEGRIEDQRRGVLKDANLKQRMREVGLDPEKLAKLKKGTALNEAEMQVAIGILLDKGDQVRAAAKKAQDDNSTANLLEAQRVHNEYVAIHAAVAGAKAESGRALRIQRVISEAFKAQNRSNYEKVMEALGGRHLSEEEARRLLQIPDNDTTALHRFLRDHAQYSTKDKITAYWINSILSGPRTQIRNILGNVLYGPPIQAPLRAAYGVIDPLMARMQGRPREFFTREAWYAAKGYAAGMLDGAARAAYIIKNGFDYDEAEKLEMPHGYQFSGKMAAFGMPGRALTAADAMFKTMAFRGEMYAQAVRKGMKEGLRGKELTSRVAELLDTPTPEMVDAAFKQSRFETFNSSPDKISRALINLRNQMGIVGTFVEPFISTPYNIVKTSGEMTPLGLGRLGNKDVRKGPEATKVLGKVLVGAAVMAMLAAMYENDRLTGAAPRSAVARDSFFNSGKQPFSVKIGNRWVAYNQATGPLALLAASAAAFGDAWKDGTAPTSKRIGQALATIGASIADQSMFTGISNLMDAIRDPMGKGSQLFESVAQGFVPFSALDRNVQQALDNKVRSPQGIYERLISGLPILSKNVPAKVDTLGREVERRGGSGMAAFLPSPIPEDIAVSPVDAELSRLADKGLRLPGFVSNKLSLGNQKEQLSREERTEYQKLRGGLLRQVLEAMISDPEYKAMTDSEKISEIESMTHAAENAARERYQATIFERRQQRPSAGVPLEGPQ
jgi:hypothetical protein